MEQSEQKTMPDNVLLEESEVLELTKYNDSEDRNDVKLDVLDQAIILGKCVNIKNNNPHHCLTFEQMRPYIERVIQDGLKGDWTVSSTALLFRCHLERERPKTVERSILQLQVLVEQFHDEKPPAIERLQHIFHVAYPSNVRLQKIVGEGFLALNANKSALEIFQNLELWSLVIECYGRLGEAKKAEEVARAQLAIKETPEMWCNLGDILKDTECYHKAWELSGHRYARAMRTLGLKHFGKQEYAECIETLTKSLAINPMYPKAWLYLGCARMRTDDLDAAAQCFLKVVNQVPDDGETWNNLAAVYLRLDKKEEAFKAFEQAIKYLQESTKLWHNMLYCCLETERWQQGMFTISRLVLLDADCLDLDALKFLVGKAIQDRNSRGALQRAMGQLVETISASKLSSNPQVWELFAAFYNGIGDSEKTLAYLQKQNRALLAENWLLDSAKFESLAESSILLATALVESGDAKNIFGAKTSINSLVKQAENNFHANEWYAKLVAKQEELKA